MTHGEPQSSALQHRSRPVSHDTPLLTEGLLGFGQALLIRGIDHVDDAMGLGVVLEVNKEVSEQLPHIFSATWILMPKVLLRVAGINKYLKKLLLIGTNGE